MTMRVPGQIRVGLFILAVILAVGCKAFHGNSGEGARGKSYTNLVFLTGTGSVDVVDGTPADGIMRGDSVYWVSANTPPLEFCVIFSPTDDPEEDHVWKFKHGRDHKGDAFIKTRHNVSAGIPYKSFKYTVVAFEDIPTATASAQRKLKPNEAQSIVSASVKDPFIIIKNW